MTFNYKHHNYHLTTILSPITFHKHTTPASISEFVWNISLVLVSPWDCSHHLNLLQPFTAISSLASISSFHNTHHDHRHCHYHFISYWHVIFAATTPTPSPMQSYTSISPHPATTEILLTTSHVVDFQYPITTTASTTGLPWPPTRGSISIQIKLQ